MCLCVPACAHVWCSPLGGLEAPSGGGRGDWQAEVVGTGLGLWLPFADDLHVAVTAQAEAQ